MTEITSITVFLVSVLPSLSVLDPDLSGLKLVHLVYRHGDRTPIKPYPTDPYKNKSSWPVGFGQLTPTGKESQYNLGKWIRDRYSGFLSTDYNPDEIYIRSTDVDRTLMSALSNLAGLYPPDEEQKFNTKLDWQPIPVHTVPQTEDDLLSSHASCPRFEQLQKEIEQGEFMKNIYSKNRELFEYISKNAGDNITDIVHLDYVYDTLLIENLHNMTLPEWTKSIFPGGKFEELRDLSFTIDTFTHELKRLKGGPFLNELVGHIHQVKEGTLDPPDRKMFMYSGHDTTVAPILHTLGVFDIKAPPFASMIIIELFDRSGLFVRVSYRNSSNEPPTILSIPGCDQLCPLKKFEDLTESVRPVNWRSECGLSDQDDGTVRQVVLVAAVAAVGMALTVLTATMLMVCRKQKKDVIEGGGRYQRVLLTEDE